MSRRALPILLLALVLASCGGPDPQAALVGKWTQTVNRRDSQDITLTAEGILYKEGSKGYQCWAINNGAFVMYARGKQADIPTNRQWAMAWDGVDTVTLTEAGDTMVLSRTSTSGELTTEGKLVAIETTLTSDAATPTCAKP